MPKLTRTALKRKKPVTDELLIPADDAQAQKLADAEEAVRSTAAGLQLAQVAGESDETAASLRLANARAKREEVRAEIRKTGLSIVLVSAGKERYDEVMLECPPTEEQKKKAEDDGEGEPLYDPDVFWPTLVAVSVPDSDLTAEDWRKLVFESPDWGPTEIKQLKDRTLDLYTSSRIAELGN